MSFSPPPLILNPPSRVDDPSSAIYDLVSAFHSEESDPIVASSPRVEQSSPLRREGIGSRAGMLEIAGLGCLGCRVSALILGSAHRNGIVCSCSWLASRSSIRLGFIHFTTSAVVGFHPFYGPRPLRNQRYGLTHVVNMVPIEDKARQNCVCSTIPVFRKSSKYK